MRLRSPIGITLLCAAAAVALTAAARGGAIDFLYATRGELLGGQLWRLVTGPLVHATWGHLVRDLALVVFVGIGYGAAIGRRFGWLCLAGLAIPTAAVFALEPDIGIYYGTSGLTHALLAAAVVAELRRPTSPALRFIAMAVGAALAAKLGYEVITGAPMFPMDLGSGVRQMPVAHAIGAAVGLCGMFGADGAQADDDHHHLRRCAPRAAGDAAVL